MINKIKNGVVIILLIGFAYSLIFLFKKITLLTIIN